jgi:hypothetical protein
VVVPRARLRAYRPGSRPILTSAERSQQITAVASGGAAEGHPVDHDDLAAITPYITHNIRRLGDLDPPDTAPTTRLDLGPAPCSPAALAAWPSSQTMVPRLNWAFVLRCSGVLAFAMC